jgi:hypothetical protein
LYGRVQQHGPVHLEFPAGAAMPPVGDFILSLPATAQSTSRFETCKISG